MNKILLTPEILFPQRLNVLKKVKEILSFGKAPFDIKISLLHKLFKLKNRKVPDPEEIIF